MENTNQIKFQDDQPQFYLAKGESYVGPFRASEIYQKLNSKEISWIDFCYREKEAAWVRLADHPVFQPLQAQAPKPVPVVAAPPPPPKAVAEVKWFLFQSETQSGPYSAEELKRLKQSGQVQAGAFVWQEKFSEWKAYAEVSELAVSTVQAPPAPSSKAAEAQDRRVAPRKPLVAHIYLTNQKEITKGLCRDISIGGMQVLTDDIPAKVGETIQLNVLPPESSGLKAFVAEGVIVRILEDRRGFSFRFTALKDDAKRSIESYIA